MWYIDPVPNDSGAYSPPQSTPFDSAIPLTDEQSDMLVQHNGFVAITREPDPEMEGSTVTVVPSISCLLYTSPSPRDRQKSRMPSSA